MNIEDDIQIGKYSCTYCVRTHPFNKWRNFKPNGSAQAVNVPI